MSNVIANALSSADSRLISESRYGGEAIFDTSEAAVRFALRLGTLSPSKDTLGRLQGINGTHSLVGDERAGQVGMLLSRLGTLTELQRALLIVRWGTRSMPCTCRHACCSGWAPNADWLAGVRYLIDASVEALSGRITHYRMRDGIIRRWAGERVQLELLADACGVNRKTVYAHNKVLREWLQRAFVQASAAADRALRGAIANA